MHHTLSSMKVTKSKLARFVICEREIEICFQIFILFSETDNFVPIRGLSIAETPNCGKRDGGRRSYQKWSKCVQICKDDGKIWTCDSNISSVSHRASLTIRGVYRN